MAKYNCKVCEIEYESPRFSKYCKPCAYEVERKRYNEYRRKKRAKERENREPKSLTCLECNVSFKGFTRSKKYCSDTCKAIAQRRNAKEARRRNKDKIRETSRQFYIKNKERIAKRNKKWALSNPEKVKEKLIRYRENNPERCREQVSRRRAARLRAFPEYVNRDEINNVYRLAKIREKSTGEVCNVDHIIPLQNKKVCGLHVPWNLQIITFEENMCKNNKFDGTYENESWKLDFKENTKNDIN